MAHRWSAPGPPDKLIHAVIERFRCPSGFLDFRLGGECSSRSGFFHFGPDAVCYGRSTSGTMEKQPVSPLHDLRQDISFDGKQVLLPFDPDEIIDNLRLERYPDCRLNRSERALKSTYYLLRPFTNRRLRSLIQGFRASSSRNMGFPRWPVDSTVENIFDSLLGLALLASGVDRIPFIWFWPDGAQACVSMTHDVETQAGLDFCTELMDLDDSFGIKASFQLVPEGRYSVSEEFLRNVRKRGYEVCVQDLNHDGRLFDRIEEFCRRAAMINCYGRAFEAIGFRSAVLYRRPEWFEHLDFSYDMSMPNVAHLDPQRGGCCTLFPYFIGNLLEIPLSTTQDYTLFHVLNQRSVDLWRLQLEMILARNGLATFLVHPDYIIDHEVQFVYKQLLEMLREACARKPLWIALPGEINAWWRARNAMSVVKVGNSWRIEGEGAERATLAFAKYANGRVIYELVNSENCDLNFAESHSQMEHWQSGLIAYA